MGTQSLLFLILFFFLSLHSTVFVFSKLSATQNSFMINLFELLKNQSSYIPISWGSDTDPCSWEGVTCNSVTNSVTRLKLSNLALYNSSFIAIACQIDSLEALDISKNKLTSIPDEFVTSCGKLPNLKELDFSWNGISGDLPAFNTGFTNLELLHLSANSLSGSIEQQFDGLGLECLLLSSNNLQGRIPKDLLALPKLYTVDLSDNQLVGAIPENISSSLVNLRLGHNSLHGSILLNNFGMLENLVQLDLRNNSLSGNIPADIGLCHKLSSLDLSENLLSGILPKQLGNLKQLQVLNLQLNHFVGKIPREITKLSNLKSLDISSNSFTSSIPSSISNLTNLQYLYMKDNYLSGSIPMNIGNMSSLYEVQLGNNHLSGEIPLMPQSLQTLNLSNNLLQGQIPASSLESLNTLILSNNRISGPIPDMIAYGSQYLTDLDLSNNQLSGSIPSQLGLFGRLSSLNLSYNLLSGEIPPMLQSHKNVSFIGNLDLCGKPLTILCPPHESNSNFYIGLYVSIGLGFYLGFWGVCGTLVLKDAWRHAYFKLVDNIYNKIYVTVAIYFASFKRNTQT